jgi:acetyl esterase/lipase
MRSVFLCLLLVITTACFTQSFPVKNIFPEGTVFYQNIHYVNDTLQKHLLDIYLPPHAKKNLPLIVWIHGGAWMQNDKYSDMDYMKNTVKSFIDSGYILASINYRYSTDSVFPAQIRDCNSAIEFLYLNASKYNIDKNKIAVIGFSAGGHLASLLALSNNNNVKQFCTAPVHFKIRLALDFYGPADFIMLAGNPDKIPANKPNPALLLLGATPVNRPDIARFASPVTWVDKNDPPFLIVQGEKDQSVPDDQSKILHSWLTLYGVKNDLIIVPGAPHFGPMFDADYIRQKVFQYLNNYLR